MAHIKSLGAARYADLSVSLLATGTAAEFGNSNGISFSQLETIVSTIKTVPTKSGLSTAAGDNTALAAAMTSTVGAANTVGLFAKEGDVAADVSLSLANTKNYVRIRHVKEFPSIGTPANIVKVPNYGKKNSLQIQGQADAPTMELTVNYVAGLWENNSLCTEDPATGNFVPSFAKVGDGRVYLFRFTLLDAKPDGYDAVKGVAGTVNDDSIADTGALTLTAVENTSYYFLGKMEALEVTPSLTDAITAKLTIAVQSDIYGAFTVD
jgi:hypothetical protein